MNFGKEQKQVKFGNFCTHCGVPEDQHGTACGWQNANTIFFPWETSIPAAITPEEKQLQWIYQNDMGALIKLLPHRVSILATGATPPFYLDEATGKKYMYHENNIMKYTKLPIEIEAMLFNEETKQSVYNWVRGQQMNIQPSFDDNNQPVLIIPTLEGDMICSIGDYLIKEPFPTDWRKFYPCKPDIFAKTYTATPANNTDEPKQQYSDLELLLSLCEENGKPCDGFRFRELVLSLRKSITKE